MLFSKYVVAPGTLNRMALYMKNPEAFPKVAAKLQKAIALESFAL